MTRNVESRRERLDLTQNTKTKPYEQMVSLVLIGKKGHLTL